MIVAVGCKGSGYATQLVTWLLQVLVICWFKLLLSVQETYNDYKLKRLANEIEMKKKMAQMKLELEQVEEGNGL